MLLQRLRLLAAMHLPPVRLHPAATPAAPPAATATKAASPDTKGPLASAKKPAVAKESP